MRTRGIYIIEEAFAYTLEIWYDYYWMDGDEKSPPESELEVTKVHLNGKDIGQFYTDFLEYQVLEQLNEYAQENKHDGTDTN
jgi:hypothetical protein